MIIERKIKLELNKIYIKEPYSKKDGHYLAFNFKYSHFSDYDIKADVNDRVIRWGQPDDATLITQEKVKEFKKHCKKLINNDAKNARSRYKEFNFKLSDYYMIKNGYGNWTLFYMFHDISIPADRSQRHEFSIRGYISIDSEYIKDLTKNIVNV